MKNLQLFTAFTIVIASVQPQVSPAATTTAANQTAAEQPPKLAQQKSITTPPRFSQNTLEPREPGSSYIRERNFGDLQAAKFRDEFDRKVCESVRENFCPTQSAAATPTLKSCFEQIQKCGAPKLEINSRFISKYGVGSVSANRDVLPDVKRVVTLLKLISATEAGSSLPKELESRATYIAKVTNHPRAQVIDDLKNLLGHFQVNRDTKLEFDYWGYFQQQYPLRHSADRVGGGQLNHLVISFRYCSPEHRFIVDSKRIVGDVLATLLYGAEQVTYPDFKTYQDRCVALGTENGDYDENSGKLTEKLTQK
ncbi:MAG: hypothetical protein EOP04_08830 [Proteobacteria bacterium]|nr:MAG: hypothetical protein EOP04_08830 [Pseudomonadota bacterium]